MATIKEIAKLAGVSRGTVDRVLNNRPGVKPDTAEAIRHIAQELGYEPNLAGQLLAARKKAMRLAFLSFDVPEYVFFHEVNEAAQKKAAELSPFGVSVEFFLIQDMSVEGFQRLFDAIEAANVDGVAAVPMDFDLFEGFLSRMRARGVPFVFFNADLFPDQRLCYVGCDYIRQGRVAAGLTALCVGGQGKVGILTHRDSDNPSYIRRTEGYITELVTRCPGIYLLDEGAPTVFWDGYYDDVRYLIRAHPELQALYIVNLGDYSVCRVAHEAAEGRHLSIITNDLVPTQKEMLREGIISATLGQQPEVQGGQPLQLLYEYLMFGVRPTQDRYYTDLNIYISQNV